jgi:hypothetical protein
VNEGTTGNCGKSCALLTIDQFMDLLLAAKCEIIFSYSKEKEMFVRGLDEMAGNLPYLKKDVVEILVSIDREMN